MSPVEWYYARDNNQMGPVSSLELKRLATAGDLEPEHLVWREGMTEWSLARNVRGLFEEEEKPVADAIAQPAASAPETAPLAAPSTEAKPTVITPPRVKTSRHPFDLIFDRLRPRFSAQLIEAVTCGFQRCGSYGLLLAIALVVAAAVLLATKAEPLSRLLTGAIMVLVLAALQYTSDRCCDSLQRLSQALSGRVTSAVFPDCFSLLSKIVGVVILLGSIAVAVETAYYPALLAGVAGFIVFAFLALVAMNPAALNILTAPQLTPSDEALGLLTFVVKALMRTVPIAFGVGVISATAMLGYACYLAFVGGDHLLVALVMVKLASTGLIYAGLLPLLAYVLFLLFCLLLKLCQAILSLPVGLPANAPTEKPNEVP